MVNLSKRMHKLMPLWNIKSGSGAAVLPPKAPAPQLTSLILRLPNPCNAHDEGARKIWKHYLPGLRYHNLTLPIIVEQSLKPGPSFVPTMTLQFESQDREILDKIQAKPETSDAESLRIAKSQFESREQQRKMLEIDGAIPTRKDNVSTPVSWETLLRAEQEGTEIPKGSGTTIGEVQTKAQPAANPSAPSTTSPPATIYTRQVTLGLRARTPAQIWGWFESVTQARHYERSREDRAGKRRYGRFFKKAREDRKRVKAGIDAIRREKAELKRAREAAEQMATEL